MVDSAHGTGARALFLDRDGVINVDFGYVHRVADFKFVDGVFDLARAAVSAGYKLIVVTNQAGIGRGYYSEEQFHELTRWMCAQFELNGASICRVYFSPYHPTEGVGKYRMDEETRKPRPGMLLQAQRDLGLSLRDSVMVGDKISDIQAGLAAGVGLNLLLRAYGDSMAQEAPCATIESLRDALPYFC